MALNITKTNKKLAVETPGGGVVETVMASVTVKHPDGSVEDVEIPDLPVVVGSGPFANVGVRAKRTINLGNYENVQIEVSLHLPSTNEHDEIQNSFNYASAWVDAKMQDLSDKYSPPKT
jgi:hypothetical protein